MATSLGEGKLRIQTCWSCVASCSCGGVGKYIYKCVCTGVLKGQLIKLADFNRW